MHFGGLCVAKSRKEQKGFMAKADTQKRCGKLPSIEVVDLFCGIGGLSYGMKSKGLSIIAGFDLDKTCKYAYETNTGGLFFFKDVKSIAGDEITKLYLKKKPIRDALAHTSRLTMVAKNKLNTTYENIKARIVSLLNNA